MHRPPLDTERLRRDLRSLPGAPEPAFFTGIEVVDSTGSTNADLIARAADPGIDRVVLVAETQDSGRGRHARAWASPPRAQIALSMLLRPEGLEPTALGWLPLLTGIAVVDAVRRTAELPAALKWPNDVLIDDRKVAGILAEVVTGGPVPAVVVGVGLNVSLTEDELPVPHATSLTVAGAGEVDRTELVGSLLAEFARRFTAWRDAGWATEEMAAAYRERCATLGTPVRAELPGGRMLTGIARDIDSAGRLLIGEEPVSAGDVTHLRPHSPQPHSPQTLGR
ncbi:biotin--[acetyl-CoA-carboxylase] ligase [Nocardia donostiensis]|uniref:biotin--[biotin carboxyl-carrier protein] ligase n=1 Tax=Nocardia donostiensis TaxID=1538463 RepID=A0A1V2TCE7_9NOCA|nr:biotin--[acetyl-CoA-carboxylase] ligase [Nocardia donostiensis]ONM47011.1 biotin--[acetyl-CoA-carboxylase] ligase [Nocardia donostiensis]OQS14617.1 biotin--[acetyl-CoA-carboxylase] ligase [Nocardia donostiensis]OQS16508.1 biotin--[acetyl-CoA-carboxylase] ligase [Nocardia donostiensis]